METNGYHDGDHDVQRSEIIIIFLVIDDTTMIAKVKINIFLGDHDGGSH